jgi:hypothetical protein
LASTTHLSPSAANPGHATDDQENVMGLSKRRLALATIASALGFGGVLLPGGGAMAATVPTDGVTAASHSTTASAPASLGTTGSAPSLQPSDSCGWSWPWGYPYDCW